MIATSTHGGTYGRERSVADPMSGAAITISLAVTVVVQGKKIFVKDKASVKMNRPE